MRVLGRVVAASGALARAKPVGLKAKRFSRERRKIPPRSHQAAGSGTVGAALDAKPAIISDIAVS